MRVSTPGGTRRRTSWVAAVAAVMAMAPAGASAAPTVTEFSTGISEGAAPRHIAAGPDGRLWFTESGTDHVGAITTAGTVTEYSEGITPGANLEGITAGPDGNLWFAEWSAHSVGRITPGGTVNCWTGSPA